MNCMSMSGIISIYLVRFSGLFATDALQPRSLYMDQDNKAARSPSVTAGGGRPEGFGDLNSHPVRKQTRCVWQEGM